ncbi:site-specific DNA-methyltransferase [Mesorhizobium helmanticense]|uniref:site-specific DNA-methyltransferase n=1 Tax=Mesorhizobium helmanticense TaxID=1776423 RepID=UPI001FE21A85|nr:site-specific DNA-methyltransferase [Mesorhizobium helmanticense]
MARPPKSPRIIDILKHEAATRRNIPTAEMESFFRRDEDTSPMPPKHYARARPLTPGATRTAEEPAKPELIWNGARISISDEQMQELAETGSLTLSDAQLVWRGKDRQDWSNLVVNVPPLYIQEKIHPKAIIDDLKRRTALKREANTDAPDLFADFNGIEPDQRAEFYQHDQHWSNRMILGDSLQVMASMAERESLRGKVQCIYFDPPYGIKFNSNWQVSTQSRDVKDSKQTDISREPEQVKAFRDTWKDNIHSYLTYLRDRLTVMRDLLTESGSIFVQIGDENVHRVRAVLDEVFGAENSVALIPFVKTSGLGASGLPIICDYLLWFAKRKGNLKYRPILLAKAAGEAGSDQYTWTDDGEGRRRKASKSELSGEADNLHRLYRIDNLTSGAFRPNTTIDYRFRNKVFHPGNDKCWKTTPAGLDRLTKADRLQVSGNTLSYVRFINDFAAMPIKALWTDTGTGGFGDEKYYVVQTTAKIISRCILLTTDPGDLVLDPTCGSGSTAYASEQWGRRWITIDTSRVALALARTRLMSALSLVPACRQSRRPRQRSHPRPTSTRRYTDWQRYSPRVRL